MKNKSPAYMQGFLIKYSKNTHYGYGFYGYKSTSIVGVAADYVSAANKKFTLWIRFLGIHLIFSTVFGISTYLEGGRVFVVR